MATTIFGHSRRVVPIAEKIYLKYLGTLDHTDDAKMLTEYPRNVNTVLLEISHKFFSA